MPPESSTPDDPSSERVDATSDAREILVVVGNPQAPSRTSAAAALVGERLAALTGSAVRVVELAPYGPGLLSWGDEGVEALRAEVTAARALVIASPTYKAAYTGLTKLFLDRFDAGQLAGVPTVAMMTGGSPAHSLAVAVHLTPVLTEIGASCPARGLYLQGPEIDDPAPAIDVWFAAAEPALRRALAD